MNQEFYIYLLQLAVIGTIIIWLYLNKCKKSNLDSTSKDTITGLPDRASFEKDFEEILMNLKGGEKAVLLNIDIKKFSKFNDSLGFDVGELLLEEIGIRLRNFTKKQVKVYRFMCNEFTIIIQKPLGEIEESIKLCENITDVLNKSYDINEYQLNVTISIGIAIYPVDGDNVQILIKNSDIAKRRVNNFTKERYLFYSAGMKKAVFEELIIENSLENAIENEELVIYYQPKVNVNTVKIVSAEALLRWNHPSFGIISPAKFIPLSESTGQIIDIGEWVVTKVCKQIEVWKKMKCAICQFL